MKPLLICTALSEEMNAVTEGLDSSPPFEKYVKCITGMGKRAAPVVEKQLQDIDPSGILVLGYCGGLSKSLKNGDIFWVTEATSENSKFLFSSEGISVDLPEVRAKRGRLLTVSEPVRSRDEKIRLGEETGALAVDMESYGIMEVAKARGKPCSVVRVVIDDVHTDLPKEGLSLELKENIKCANQVLRSISVPFVQAFGTLWNKEL